MADPQNAILFLFVGIVIGGITMYVLSNFANNFLPYTVVIFMEGILIAEINKHERMGIFSDSIDQWINIEADLILYVFLPALLFGEAMSLNWYHVKGGFFQAMLLAGPGVVMGAFLMGVFVFLWMPFDWSWNQCMIFGSIVSATDPVAVVALLKEAGASSKLTILIIGESLMNDGTAFVLFMLYYKMSEGASYDLVGILNFFVSMSFGSCLLGVFFGILSVRWLRCLNRPLVADDNILQIAMTLCCGYLSFYVAQELFQISGILSCCAAGLMLAWLAPPIILNHESMHHVWSIIEWLGNSLIFLLAGLIFGDRTLETVEAVDWAHLFVLYILLMLVRAVVVFTAFPILKRIGHRCSYNDAVFIVWGGLRGALGIVLALLVEINQDSLGIPKVHADKFFFFVGGIATLTLLINASLADKVLTCLGLVGNENLDKTLVMKQIRKRMRRKMIHLVDHLKDTLNLSSDDIIELRDICSVFRNNNDSNRNSTSDQLFDPSRSLLPDLRYLIKSINGSSAIMNERRFRSSHSIRTSLLENEDNESVDVGNNCVDGLSSSFHESQRSVLHKDLTAYIRTIFLEIVRVKYWHYIHDGKLPRLSFSAQFLLYSIDVGLDNAHKSIELYNENCFSEDWVCIENEIQSNEKYILATLAFFDKMFLSRLTHFRYWFGWVKARKEKRIVYMLTSFIEAHEHAQKKIHDFVGQSEDEMLIPEEINVISESKAAVKRARFILGSMNNDQVKGIVNKQAMRNILAKQTQFVGDMVNEGLLKPKDAQVFYAEINADVKKIEDSRKVMYREQSKKAGNVLRSSIVPDKLDVSSINDTNWSLHSNLVGDNDD